MCVKMCYFNGARQKTNLEEESKKKGCKNTFLVTDLYKGKTKPEYRD